MIRRFIAWWNPISDTPNSIRCDLAWVDFPRPAARRGVGYNIMQASWETRSRFVSHSYSVVDVDATWLPRSRRHMRRSFHGTSWFLVGKFLVFLNRDFQAGYKKKIRIQAFSKLYGTARVRWWFGFFELTLSNSLMIVFWSACASTFENNVKIISTSRFDLDNWVLAATSGMKCRNKGCTICSCL